MGRNRKELPVKPFKVQRPRSAAGPVGTLALGLFSLPAHSHSRGFGAIPLTLQFQVFSGLENGSIL